MDFYYDTAKWIIRIYQRLLSLEFRVSGEVPVLQGARIIAANHPNASDSLFLPFIFKEKLHFIIQGDLFSIPFIGWLLTRCGQIPVWPERKYAAVEHATELLKSGGTVVIFPEGKLNPEHQPLAPGNGAVRLSLLTGAPIIPVCFYVPTQYLRNIVRQKKGRFRQGRWQTGGQCYIHIGCPWLPGEESGGTADQASITQLTDQLMRKIEALTPYLPESRNASCMNPIKTGN